jgi:FixJ family two-component response regulator
VGKSIKTCIAVIEDDEGLRRSLARLLRAAGYQPLTYPSAEAFFNEAKHQVFDCLVVDVQLDGMSGIELSEQLAVSGSTTPLIFLTAHEECEVLRQTIRAPFAGFLRKNESSAALFAAIDKAIHVGW